MGGDFDSIFHSLTGKPPLNWQRRLYQDWGDRKIEPVIDLPTGLGKTMVMAIWLIARAKNPLLGRRLIYVVDRRTVVDQATELATQITKKAPEAGIEVPAISTLRGQLADNREWSRDPAKPAIIIGTVDLIGSALLFSGYRSGFKTKPLHAGLLGQDSLLVLDEAHLSKPFEKLVCTINSDGRFQKDCGGNAQGKPMRVIRMSATCGDSTGTKPFTLQFDAAGSLTGDDAKDKTITDRFGATKTLSLVNESEKPVETIAAEADRLAAQKPGSRIVIFVQTPKLAADVLTALEKKNVDYTKCISQLTGTMRGLERDELVDTDDELVDTEKPLGENDSERRVMQRFLKPDNDPLQGNCFLISTSAGEVGFDLNADHLVGDAAPLDSWIQRLGRVNRRGNGDATVILVRAREPADKTDLDKACIATSKLFADRMDVSPKALAAFKKTLTPKQIDDASSPKPKMVELTDILIDAWSMTSIVEPMPGRPEVAPWIRGIADELPQTTVAWRAELDLLKDNPDPRKVLKAIFAKHPVRPHESLAVNSYRVVEFFKEVKKKRPDLLTTSVVVKLSRDIVIRTIQQIIDDDGILNADPTLILPATFGGLEKGMLSHKAIPVVPDPDSPPPRSRDVADREGYEQTEEARPRLRIIIERTDEGWKTMPLPGGEEIPADLKLDSYYENSTQLFNDLKKRSFRIRLAQPIKFDNEGERIKSLVLLAPTLKREKPNDQKLTEHVGAVEAEAERISDALQLEAPIRSALLFAARWHDEGKKADIWQYFIGRTEKHPNYLGKGASPRDPKSLKGYRHEFGSLLRILLPDRGETIGCTLPANADPCDLALHLIAAHHGLGRPHFDNAVYAQFTDTERDIVHTESIRRFARLQRKYGWWHLAWLENLLRCADATASAQAGSTGDEDETEDGA